MLSTKKRKTRGGIELLRAMRERWEVESGVLFYLCYCFIYVRLERLLSLLKLFAKSSQQYKDDQNKIPIFQEFTSLEGEKYGYIRIQEKLQVPFTKDNMKVWKRKR